MLIDKLNAEQRIAVEEMAEFLKGDKSFFLLQGYAGTGKTFSIQALMELVRGRLIFTAPTNKATKVLRDTLTSDTFKPECRTIYSLLGLRLEPNGEVKELTIPEDPVDLSDYRAVIVDEGSMVNELLVNYIKKAAKDFHIKFIFLADFAQLPPVGEGQSAVNTITNGARLETVMRHDNQILKLVTKIRNVVDHPAPTVKFASDFANGEGVWSVSANEFESRILDAAYTDAFITPNDTKVIAWRNVTVDKYNLMVRNKLFDHPVLPWLEDDRIIVMEPAKNLADEIVATTDDEGRVTSAVADYHPTWPEFKVWRVSATLDTNSTCVLQVLHEDSFRLYTQQLERFASEAKANRKLWGRFWEFKEAFHKIRHAYAITAHRAQGSTYHTAFVDWRDILLNRNRGEAYRCFYVAASRPKKRLILG